MQATPAQAQPAPTVGVEQMSLATQYRIAAIVPCHNEEAAVAKVVADLHAAVPGMTVYVYDNCSTDRTIERAFNAGAVVCSEPLKGKGNVVRRAFADIDADIYLLIDGDDTYDAAAAPADDRAARRREPRPRGRCPSRGRGPGRRHGVPPQPRHRQQGAQPDRLRHLRRQHGRHAQRLPRLLAPLREELPGRVARVRDRDRADRALPRTADPVDHGAGGLQGPRRGQRVQAAHLPRRLPHPEQDHQPDPARAPDVLLRPARRTVRPARAGARHAGVRRVSPDRPGPALPVALRRVVPARDQRRWA